MARIAFAWELGAAFGHVTGCIALARALEARGHTIAFMFRELHQLAAFPDCAGYAAFQAPQHEIEAKPIAVPVSYADILLAFGYDRPEVLSRLTSGWLELFRQWKPDLLIVDSAPTALLAARILGLKRAAFANGFAIPPRLSPLPAFRRDNAVDAQTLAATEALALSSVNAVLATLECPAMRTLAELFATDEDFLCTFPEIDHYGSRPRSAYWGPRYTIDTGADVRWSYGEGKRVLVYVRDSVPQVDALIDALIANRCRVAAFIPGLDGARRARLESSQRIVAASQMKLEPLLKGCDLMVSEGGNVAAGALMSGVPQLLFPTHYEQFLTALRLEQVGSALWLPPEASANEVAAALRRMLAEPRFKSAASHFAKRYAAFSPSEQMRRIALRIEEILGGPILSPTSNPGAAA